MSKDTPDKYLVDKEIDYSRLKRNYNTNPLIGLEEPEFEDLDYLYIELNLTKKQLATVFNVLKKPRCIDRFIKNSGLRKSKEQQAEARNTYIRKLYKSHDDIYIEKRKEIAELKKTTCIEKYGVENVYQNEAIKEKIKTTCRERYGHERVTRNKKIKEKIKRTCLRKYGKEHYTQTEEYKEKNKETCLKRYGVECTAKVKSIREKQRKTLFENYGVEHPLQSKEILQRTVAKNKEKYGVDYPAQLEDVKKKIDLTKEKNHTHNTSKEEEYIYNELCKVFKTVKRNYKCKEYPFKCDFYIQDIDTFLEYQGFWSHGIIKKGCGEPYDETNKKHIEVLNTWKKKANERNYSGKYKTIYLDAINVWTKRDPLKRKIAKENNLKWFEFFNLDEFENWFKEYKNENR